MVFTQRGDGGSVCGGDGGGGAAAAAELTDGWSDGVPRGKVGAVLYSMCTSSYPIGLESLLDFLPWDL